MLVATQITVRLDGATEAELAALVQHYGKEIAPGIKTGAVVRAAIHQEFERRLGLQKPVTKTRKAGTAT